MDSLVTIAFPVYERTTYFVEALESAIKQTIEAPIIVVDNNSSHNNFEIICSKYGERVKYYRNEKNIGMFGNWNRCFELVLTKYAIIVGDDDILLPTYIEEFYKAYNTNPNLDVYYTDLYFYKCKNGRFIETETHWNNIMGWSTAYEIKADSWKSQLLFPTISSIIKVELQKKHKFETRLHTANDKLFIYTLPDNCIFYGNPQKLYLYRRHDTNDSLMLENTLSVAHNLILLELRQYTKLSLWNLLTCYAKLQICLRKDHSLKCQLYNGLSYYSSIYKNVRSINSLPLNIIAYFFSYVIVLKRMLVRTIRI